MLSKTLSTNTSKILKIKETFPKLQAKKIENIQKIINSEDKPKPKINIMTKDPLRKQAIVPMSNNNKSKFMEMSNNHITNINRALRNIKSKVMADFICADQTGITIVINKVTSQLNLQTIEKYIKSTSNIDANKVEVPRLPQSKLYLKIIGILYLIENTNTLILADIVKSIIKNSHNIAIALRSRIIKILPRLDMAII